MTGLIENLLYRYEHARQIQKRIEGCTFRKAWSYYCDPSNNGDPIEDANRLVAKMRQRDPRITKP